MKLRTEPYQIQVARWPRTGRHILAQYDTDLVVVYQAYNREIGDFALSHGYFGGTFSFERMSWIKPNFLWMMYRSGWATKPGQEVVLAVYLKRSAFDNILNLAVHSSYVPEVYASEDIWKTAIAQSSVRLQWDPDHHPSGPMLERRAIQLGLRGSVLKQYATEWIISIDDVSDFTREQYQNVLNKHCDALLMPQETIYPVIDKTTAAKLGLSNFNSDS